MQEAKAPPPVNTRSNSLSKPKKKNSPLPLLLFYVITYRSYTEQYHISGSNIYMKYSMSTTLQIPYIFLQKCILKMLQEPLALLQ